MWRGPTVSQQRAHNALPFMSCLLPKQTTEKLRFQHTHLEVCLSIIPLLNKQLLAAVLMQRYMTVLP